MISELITKTKPAYVLFFLVFLFAVMLLTVYFVLPVHENANPPTTWGFGIDWKANIRPATLRLLHGQSPYQDIINCLPPWIYLLLAPIAVLPPDLGAAILYTLNLFIYSLVLYKRRAPLLAIVPFLLFPPTISNGLNGNVDWLVALALILPRPFGLVLAASKPQIGAGVALFWMIDAWRTGGWKNLIKLATPTAILYLTSFAIYGIWPLRLLAMRGDSNNVALGGWAIVAGIVLLVLAIKQRKENLSILATPFIAPYINFTSLSIPLLALDPGSLEYYLAIVAFWLVGIFR